MLTKESVPLQNTVLEPTDQVVWHRTRASRGIRSEIPVLVAGVGQCSTNVRDVHITRKEAVINKQFACEHTDVELLQRQNHRKQRSLRTDGTKPWEGMDDSHPEEAMKLHEESKAAGDQLCMEITQSDHLDKYTPGLVMAWFGARNRDKGFMVEAAIVEKHMLLGIKPDVTGDPEWSFTIIDALNHIRSNVGGTAPVFLIDRGGTNFDTPQKWEDNTKRLLDRTDGIMMLDLAHGSEQAHDPNGNFGKSVEGQIRAMEHYIKIGEQTGMWANGILLEASDAPSDTDPNMPHQIALDGIVHIAALMHANATSTSRRIFDDEFPTYTY